MNIKRRDFLVAGATALAAAGLPRAVRGACGAGSCCAESFKTVLKKALIRPRLTPEVVKVLKDNGYPGVELQDKKVTEAEARAARRLAEDEGVRIHSFMGGWFEFNAKDPAKRRDAIDTAKHNLHLAAAYGAPVILIVPGRVGGIKMPKPSEFKLAFDPQTLTLARAADADYPEYVQAQNDATKYAQDAVWELVPLAAELGVVIGLENVWNNLWVKPDFAAAFIRSFKVASVKGYLDLGNHERYAPSADWVDALSDQIVKLHIKDFKVDRTLEKEGTFVRIGDGTIDFKAVRRAIERVGYSGWVSIESSGWNEAEHSAIMDRFFAGTL